jgi:BTB/POZ domain
MPSSNAPPYNMSDSQLPITTPAKAPFDKDNADLILRSSDNVDFRVFKLFLSFASPFFENMFTLPQTTDHGSNNVHDPKDAVQVVPISESSAVVKQLLTFCYPCPDPVLDTLEEVVGVLEAATKYDMEDIRDRIQEMLVAPRFVEDELGHLRVFCIAIQLGLEDAAKVAMRCTRNHPAMGRPYLQELDRISPRTYHQLLDYHWRCFQAATGVTTKFGRHNDSWLTSLIPTCTECNATFGGCRGTQYWVDYMEGANSALRDRPCGATVLRSDLMDDVLKYAHHNCDSCSESAVEKLRMFITAFQQEIDRVILTVSHRRPGSFSDFDSDNV